MTDNCLTRIGDEVTCVQAKVDSLLKFHHDLLFVKAKKQSFRRNCAIWPGALLFAYEYEGAFGHDADPLLYFVT